MTMNLRRRLLSEKESSNESFTTIRKNDQKRSLQLFTGILPVITEPTTTNNNNADDDEDDETQQFETIPETDDLNDEDVEGEYMETEEDMLEAFNAVENNAGGNNNENGDDSTNNDPDPAVQVSENMMTPATTLDENTENEKLMEEDMTTTEVNFEDAMVDLETNNIKTEMEAENLLNDEVEGTDDTHNTNTSTQPDDYDNNDENDNENEPDPLEEMDTMNVDTNNLSTTEEDETIPASDSDPSGLDETMEEEEEENEDEEDLLAKDVFTETDDVTRQDNDENMNPNGLDPIGESLSMTSSMTVPPNQFLNDESSILSTPMVNEICTSNWVRCQLTDHIWTSVIVILVFVLCWLYRCFSRASNDYSERGQYRAVAAHYAANAYDDTFDDDVSYEDLDLTNTDVLETGRNKNQNNNNINNNSKNTRNGSYNNNNKNIKRNGVIEMNALDFDKDENGGLTLEEMNG